jgi:hypothetical protein
VLDVDVQRSRVVPGAASLLEVRNVMESFTTQVEPLIPVRKRQAIRAHGRIRATLQQRASGREREADERLPQATEPRRSRLERWPSHGEGASPVRSAATSFVRTLSGGRRLVDGGGLLQRMHARRLAAVRLVACHGNQATHRPARETLGGGFDATVVVA